MLVHSFFDMPLLPTGPRPVLEGAPSAILFDIQFPVLLTVLVPADLIPFKIIRCRFFFSSDQDWKKVGQLDLAIQFRISGDEASLLSGMDRLYFRSASCSPSGDRWAGSVAGYRLAQFDYRGEVGWFSFQPYQEQAGSCS